VSDHADGDVGDVPHHLEVDRIGGAVIDDDHLEWPI
jgi:hypothetical protein